MSEKTWANSAVYQRYYHRIAAARKAGDYELASRLRAEYRKERDEATFRRLEERYQNAVAARTAQ